MALRRELQLILILLVIIAALVAFIQFFRVDVVEADASKFVLEDLGTKYPAADISIMTITQMYNENGAKYFEVKAKVTEHPETPCPERKHIFYNYPAQNFVPQPAEVITSNCVVCAQGICTIAFPEEAIIASHTFPGTEDVQDYLLDFQNAVPSVQEKTDSWLVAWSSQTAESSYSVEIHRNGTVISAEER